MLPVAAAIHAGRLTYYSTSALHHGRQGDALLLCWALLGGLSLFVPTQGAGSPNQVTSSGYHRTALVRQRKSKPFRHWSQKGLVKGSVLDFGSGRGQDCAGKTIQCFEPNSPKAADRSMPSGTFDTVLLTYVLNVVPKSERKKIVRRAAKMVAPGGRLLVAVRGTGDGGYQSARQSWRRAGDGFEKVQKNGTRLRFQRFYPSGKALADELNAFVPDGFRRAVAGASAQGSVYARVERK